MMRPTTLVSGIRSVVGLDNNVTTRSTLLAAADDSGLSAVRTDCTKAHDPSPYRSHARHSRHRRQRRTRKPVPRRRHGRTGDLARRCRGKHGRGQVAVGVCPGHIPGTEPLIHLVAEDSDLPVGADSVEPVAVDAGRVELAVAIGAVTTGTVAAGGSAREVEAEAPTGT